jgi:hypothetical protein
MRKACFSLCSLFVLFTLSHCKQEDANMLEFEMPYIDYVTVPKLEGTQYLLPVTIFSKDAPTNSSKEFTQKNTAPEKVKEIRLTKFELTIVAPDGSDFGFLDWIKISLMADGVPVTEVANLYNIDSTYGNVLKLNILDKDLQEIVKQPYFRMRADIKAKKPLLEDLELKSDVRFHVIAEAL